MGLQLTIYQICARMKVQQKEKCMVPKFRTSCCAQAGQIMACSGLAIAKLRKHKFILVSHLHGKEGNILFNFTLPSLLENFVLQVLSLTKLANKYYILLFIAT